MTFDEIKMLGRLADELRSRGVTEFSARDTQTNDVLTLKLSPPLPELKAEPGAELTEKCACGHAPYEHNAGLCIQGCDPTKCAPENT